MTQFFEGFLLQTSLIVALGAQNLFVLESGLKRRRQLMVAAVCSACDTFLLFLGVAGAASVFVRFPNLKISFGVLGTLFLAYYGATKLLEARAAKPTLDSSALPKTGEILRLTFAFSLLNPHVYLDTVVLVGGYSSRYPQLLDRALFGAGAAAFSTIWFFGLAIFSARFSEFLRTSARMKVVYLVSGTILLALSLVMGREVWAWIAP